MLAHAETKNTHGLRATGVGICVCAQHEHVLLLAADEPPGSVRSEFVDFPC